MARWSAERKGPPQGAVVSPILANLFLHYAFDLQIPAHRGQSFRRIADSIPVIADSF